MRRAIFFAIPTFALFFLFSCQASDTPESVVRQWQSHIDKNEFGQAKALSAPRTVELLSWMEGIFSEMDSEVTVTHTEFKSIRCKEKGDEAVCFYTIEEEGQVFQDSFILVRINGQWRVDLPDEAFNNEENDEDLETLFELINQDSTAQ